MKSLASLRFSIILEELLLVLFTTTAHKPEREKAAGVTFTNTVQRWKCNSITINAQVYENKPRPHLNTY